MNIIKQIIESAEKNCKQPFGGGAGYFHVDVSFAQFDRGCWWYAKLFYHDLLIVSVRNNSEDNSPEKALEDLLADISENDFWKELRASSKFSYLDCAEFMY